MKERLATEEAVTKGIRGIPRDRVLEKSAVVTGVAIVVGGFVAPVSGEAAIAAGVIAVASMAIGCTLSCINPPRVDRR